MTTPTTIASGSILGQAEAALAHANKPTDETTLDKDDFLGLLVAQIQYQDPLNPMENTEFTAQMAQFSSLEQLTSIDDGINTLINASSGNQMSTAVSFIDKDVRADGYNVSLEGDKVSKIFYGMGETVTDAFLNIYGPDGDLVRTVDLGSKTPGEYEFEWDGKDWAGEDLPDGLYSIGISASTSDGQPVLVQTEVSGTVDGVIFEGGQYYLRLKDGRYLNFLNVNEVVNPGSVSTSSTTSDSSGTTTSDATDDTTSETGGDA